MDKVLAFFTDPANWQGTTGIPNRLVEHLIISGLSVALATLIAVPLGLYIGHTNRSSLRDPSLTSTISSCWKPSLS